MFMDRGQTVRPAAQPPSTPPASFRFHDGRAGLYRPVWSKPETIGRRPFSTGSRGFSA